MSMPSWPRLPLLFCVTWLGCATTDVMRTDDSRRPPTNKADVKVFLEEPSGPYTTVAIVQASDQGWGLSLEVLKRKMVERAAALGGDAVILGHQSGQPGGPYFMPAGATLYSTSVQEKQLAGKVIVFARN
jgi:hypothetical protein